MLTRVSNLSIQPVGRCAVRSSCRHGLIDSNSMRSLLPSVHQIRLLSTAQTVPEAGKTPKKLAIVGSGLSGMSSAFYFLRAIPPEARRNTKIVILDRENRSGGWCRSVRVPLKELEGDIGATLEKKADQGKHLIFEAGPRSIRPVGLPGWTTISLAQSLGLTPSIITVPKSSPSARNRYLYRGSGLMRLPSSLLSAITNPLILSILPRLALEPFISRHPSHKEQSGGDESVDSFFTRRFGKRLAEEMISAMIHGIYAGDTRRLSVRAVFPSLWHAEKQWGSVILSMLFSKLGKKGPYALNSEKEMAQCDKIKGEVREIDSELVARMESSSVWGLKGGLEKLTLALEAKLLREGVEFRWGAEGNITGIESTSTGWQISTPSGDIEATHLITSNPAVLPAHLSPLSPPSTTVSVINLAFPSSLSLPFPPGFGYLIPRTVPTSSNPHQVLGVLFDSDVMPGVDDSSPHLVKLSVLLGGSYWLPPSQTVPSPFPPSEDELVHAAMETLRLHFPGADIPEPAYVRTTTNIDCIPQAPPHYPAELRKVHEGAKAFNAQSSGKVGYAGGGTGIVGVNGAVLAGKLAGEGMAKWFQGEQGSTGLEMWEI